jgi:TonB family protein
MASSEITTAPANGQDPGDDAFQNMTEYDVHETPVVLLELQDDLARSRLREALWISLVVHLILVIAATTSPRWAYPSHVVLISPMDALKQQDMTYLALPPDIQKLTEKPKTNILSDKDRIASSRTPTLDHRQLHKILDSNREGPPSEAGAAGGPAQQAQAMARAQQPAMSQQQQPQGGGGPQLSPSQTQPKLEALRPGGGAANANPFTAAMSAGSAIEQAARATAGSRGVGAGTGGDYGLGTGRQGGTVGSQLDILSDTQGVDFGPYLERVVHAVRMNWYQLIPEVARPPLMKQGKVSIEFAITKDGRVAGMRLVGQSGDVSLDRAAWGGITASDPFAPLPSEFHGQYLALRFHFYYNPRNGQIE